MPPTKKLGEILDGTLKGVEEATKERILRGDRIEEDHITSTLFTVFEDSINDRSLDGLVVRTRQFRGRGPNSDESITGADGAVILDAKLKDTEFRKFYIFQAKNQAKGFKFDERSIDQKFRMLSWTPDSFFLLYSPVRFKYISALLVGLNNRPGTLPFKSFTKFHQDFFDCFIGDQGLRLPFYFPLRPWWRFLEEFEDFTKFNERNPLARRNLFIEILLEG